MHIIKRELRANAKSLLIWSGVMIVLVIGMISEFSGYYNNPEMANILDSMPEALMTALSLTGSNLTTPSGYISITAVYFYLILGVFAVLLGSNIISKEERDKTAEFLLTLPVSREQVILSKWVAAIINCMAITIVTGMTIIVTMLKYDIDKPFYKFIFLLMVAVFITQMIFLSIGMLLASVLKRYKASGKISASILMILYMLSVISALSSKLDKLKYVTPFKFFEPSSILLNSRYELEYVLISLGIVIVCMVGTFIIYPKRDLHL
jgi:ABC-2 type transport system permease protein